MEQLVVDVPRNLVDWLQEVADEESDGDIAPILSEMLGHLREAELPIGCGEWSGASRSDH